ncbi:alpha-galactosidase [Stachybotrys elegans]|uniref:Acyl-coenzyme A diphosphatase SCS3 n=1 Tax=Stachybotrys elegans TaxID=80388 RepID=A0A8K0T7C0_9HYPO|nr:alpha-galactosidase [Stachybotrys elegans]
MVTTRRGATTSPVPEMSSNTSPKTASSSPPRTPPFLPTPLETLVAAAFPAILIFGTVFSLLSPQTRAAPYDPISQSHYQDPAVAPSYFARKSNVFNVFFVKRGWAWTTLAILSFLATHPAFGPAALSPRRLRAASRGALVTAWWFLVTQWCFGAPIIDRGFRWTGGKCELAQREVEMGDTSVGEMVTAVACKAAGGRWNGGHDISGHVFLLVLSTSFLLQEVGWEAIRWSGWRKEERSIIMPDGALKSAGVEAEMTPGEGAGKDALSLGGRVAVGIMGLSLWMLLMTAIYFHTWFEKLTGLLTATIGLYAVYYVPRFIHTSHHIMNRVKPPANLPALVKQTFAKARADNELHYFPTQVTTLTADSIPFQLRFSPALANKPKGPSSDPAKPSKPFDPFANPPAGLLVTDLAPSHFLVLNKFAVVPEHFILATKEYKLQTHVLEEDDLEATLACIKAYEDARGDPEDNDGLYAFFNCGEHSGASQPHRHIQLLPVARMRDGLGPESSWSVLAERLDAQKAPFATFAETISLEISSADLYAAYLRVYRRACRAMSAHMGAAETDEAPAKGESRISYNMAMTRSTIVVCPRVTEGANIVSTEGVALGSLALNGTLLAGTALVKNELEWEALKRDPEGLLRVLKAIGIPVQA